MPVDARLLLMSWAEEIKGSEDKDNWLGVVVWPKVFEISIAEGLLNICSCSSVAVGTKLFTGC